MVINHFKLLYRNAENIRRRNLRDASDPFQLSDKVFVKYFRMPKVITRNLINSLRLHIEPAKRKTAIPLELKVQ